ncbi:hypothetical protein F3N42_07865 [Marinihelvus fidelis]|uniref:Uncharacterized protein n=1 Tax=Marinihelvus fidelis TaxID=2613842 RepID=A0A5N0TE11_9GAMM|nr:hypothetical protein [Marinihelvus fidelis]KAA9132076.1 hypothetical protein F3N42_07865 [Marinihelvus fidelis]
MSFLFLKNLGTPTSWDGTDYFGYRLSIIDKLSPALQCMTSDERYEPGGLDSFWNSWVTNAGFDGENLQLDFFNPANNKLFSFHYFGVRRIRSDYRDLRGKPSMAVQELCLLPRVDVFRHAIVSPFGKFLVVYSTSMDFSETRVH